MASGAFVLVQDILVWDVTCLGVVPQLAADIPSVHVWQHQVEEDQVWARVAAFL
jgi:hypothetical protein